MILRKKNSEQGFTLIEISIVIVIAGVLLSILSSALLSYVKKSKIDTTEFRMDKIEDALGQYLTVNRKYPCAASRVAGPDDAEFGREATADCNTAAGAGTGDAAPTIRSGGVRIGAVPTRSLSLPDEFATDGWGNKFTFAVTEDLASSPRGAPVTRYFEPDGGEIIVRDSNNNELVQAPSNPNSRAHYVIVSHGPGGDGSYPLYSVTEPPIDCLAGSLEQENCNNDRTFRATLTNSDVTGANFFDDYVRYQGQTEPVPIIPRGAVIAFDDNGCPTDGEWEVYAPAQGRFVRGQDNNVDSQDQYQIVIRPGSSAIQPNNNVGGQGDNDAALLPPYVTLIYCRKIN